MNSRLDYCNALLYGAPASISLSCKECKTTQLVWFWQQVDAVMPSRCFASSSAWLSVRQRILYKTAVTTRKVLTTGVPAYLKEHLVRHAATRQTRSAARPLLTVPRTNTVFARRSFSCAASATWNNLPADVLLCNSESSFKNI